MAADLKWLRFRAFFHSLHTFRASNYKCPTETTASEAKVVATTTTAAKVTTAAATTIATATELTAAAMEAVAEVVAVLLQNSKVS